MGVLGEAARLQKNEPIMFGSSSEDLPESGKAATIVSSSGSQASLPGMMLGPDGAVEVIENVVHYEAPAERDAETLQLQADNDWASLVEMSLHNPENSVSDMSSAPEEVFLLQFGGGVGSCLREALLTGPEFRACRDALDHDGHQCVHPSSQAIILVGPWQYQDVCRALTDHEVHQFHVVITASLEYVLAEVLGTIPCRRRPRQKNKLRKTLRMADTQEYGNSEGSKGFEEEEVFQQLVEVIKRTRLCIAPPLLRAQSVVQSTTEVVSRGVNPRRLQVWM